MAASPMSEVHPTAAPQEKWNSGDDSGHDLETVTDSNREANGSAPANGGEARATVQDTSDDYRSDAPGAENSGKPGAGFRDRQIKPNKVYIGGLPENTRQEDLQNCFGKIGEIVNIELKLGYGFVEFDNKEAAEESVAKYHEGFFMGNKIRVELSHGGGRALKAHGDPGACFKCGLLGHWARECTNAPQSGGPHRKPSHHADHPMEHSGRDYSSRDYPPRDYPQYSREYDYGRYPPARDSRYGYDYPTQPPPHPSSREYRRPASPPRDYRDYPAPARRDYDDYRARPAAPAPVPPVKGYYPPEAPPGYPPRSYDAPPPPLRDYADRGPDRRPSSDKYSQYPPASRPRTPPGPPPRSRDEYERPPRDYPPSATTEYRGRATPPPLLPPSNSRYSDYPRNGGVDQRYRRRSQSPPPRSSGSGYRSGNYGHEQSVDPVGYPTGGPPYSSATGSYSGNGYNHSAPSAPPRGGSVRDRDFAPRGGPELSGGYSRRG